MAAAVTTRDFQKAMLAIPGRVASQLAGQTDATRVHTFLSGAIREALAGLADQSTAEISN